MFQPSRLLTSLNRHGVEAIVVGMGAAVMQGVPTSTADLDVVHQRSADNVRRLLECIREWCAVFRGDPRNLVPDETHLCGPGHQLLTTVYGDIDLLGSVGPADRSLGYEELLPRTRILQADDYTVRVLDLDFIIELKREAGRPKDLALIPLLESTLRRIR